MTELQDLRKRELQERMTCERCGHCCTETDPIRVLPADLSLIAYQYHQDFTRAKAHFTKLLDAKTGARGIKHTMPCMFYDPSIPGCKIYEIRPKVCRDAPFLNQIGNEKDAYYYDTCQGSKKALGVQ